MKPVVFLDMDGVLSHFLEQFFGVLPAMIDQEVDKNFIHPEKARMLANFVNENELNVVLSSDWRRRFQFASRGPKAFADYFFESTGCTIPVIGFTPNLGHRGMDIDSYVQKHKVENYVILDDCEDMLPSQLQHFVHVNHLNGLTMSDLVIASNMLHLDNELSGMVRWIKWHQAYKYYRPGV